MKFEDLLNDLGVSVAPEGHHHTRDGWLQFDCPFCAMRGHYRMGYNQRNKYVNCWTCGRHSVYDVLLALGVDRRTIKQMVADIEVDTKRAKEIERRGTLRLPRGMGPLHARHREYLEGRGFDPSELIRLWQLKGTTFVADILWRIVVPIFHHGDIVSWTSRSIRDDGMRWLSASPDQEIMNHKKLLYGFDYVRHSIIVCEGPSDVWAIGPGAVGTLGVGYSMAQVEKIATIPNRIICFDSSPDAQRRARQLTDTLMVFSGTTQNVVLDAKDPASSSKRERQHLRRLLAWSA